KVVANSGIAITLSPSTATVHAGQEQFNFTASVSGTTNTAVTWTANGASFSSTLGSITAAGTYTSPDTVPNPNAITITATSSADTTKQASAVITLINPAPSITGVSPSSIGVGAFMITVTGKGFAPGAVVNFGGAPLTTMVTSSTELVATGTASASQVGSVAISVTNPNPGTSTSPAFNAQVVGSAGGVVS